ncbi:hypothetical protein [Microbacterium sp.]|uniref:hypothetical protein n=1 Tax=Microbacterium sp. TaxID=51671 RepID=UPI003A94946E
MKRRTTNALSAAVVTAAFSVVLCGCSASTAGPLAMGGESGSLCVAAAANEPYAIGEVVTPAEDVTIDRIELIGARGLDQPQPPVVIELRNGATAIGALPLSEVAHQYEDTWSTRRNAVGAVLSKGSDYSLVVVLESATQSGSAHSMKVFYRSAGRDYEAEGTTSYAFKTHC